MSDDLSSDILERQFGPAEIKVLLQDGAARVICTESAGGQVLELSRVFFKQPVAEGLADVHREILSGTSMGKAFRQRGIVFKRRTRGVYLCGPGRLPAAFRARFGERGPATVVDVSIVAGPRLAPYADILEVYSPAVSWPAAGRAISEAGIARLREFESLLTDSAD